MGIRLSSSVFWLINNYLWNKARRKRKSFANSFTFTALALCKRNARKARIPKNRWRPTLLQAKFSMSIEWEKRKLIHVCYKWGSIDNRHYIELFKYSTQKEQHEGQKDNSELRLTPPIERETLYSYCSPHERGTRLCQV